MNEVNESRLLKMEKIFSYHEREAVMLVIDYKKNNNNDESKNIKSNDE